MSLQCEVNGCQGYPTAAPTTAIPSTTTTAASIMTTQIPLIGSCSSSTAADCFRRRNGFYAFANCCQRFTVCHNRLAYLGVRSLGTVCADRHPLKIAHVFYFLLLFLLLRIAALESCSILVRVVALAVRPTRIRPLRRYS